MKVLRQSVGVMGMNLHDDVETVQYLLKLMGCDPGPVDGVCGPKTIRAIRDFQRRFMVDAHGLIERGQQTWAHLSSFTAARPSAHLVQWGGDSRFWSQSKKLESMVPPLRPKVEAVVAALKERGFQAKIWFGWRSVAVQLQLFREGKSSVRFSFHNVQYRDGTPNAYAADIIDRRYGWEPPATTSGFWQALGEEAKARGLYWGGDWTRPYDPAHVQLVANSELGRLKIESGL